MIPNAILSRVLYHLFRFSGDPCTLHSISARYLGAWENRPGFTSAMTMSTMSQRSPSGAKRCSCECSYTTVYATATVRRTGWTKGPMLHDTFPSIDITGRLNSSRKRARLIPRKIRGERRNDDSRCKLRA